MVGVSESTLKRWADGGRLRFTKTAGGHRRISVPEAVRFARRSRLPIVDPELLGLPGVSAQTTRITAPGQGVAGADPPRSSADTAAVLAELLRCDQPVQARALVTGLYLRGLMPRAVGSGRDVPITRWTQSRRGAGVTKTSLSERPIARSGARPPGLLPPES